MCAESFLSLCTLYFEPCESACFMFLQWSVIVLPVDMRLTSICVFCTVICNDTRAPSSPHTAFSSCLLRENNCAPVRMPKQSTVLVEDNVVKKKETSLASCHLQKYLRVEEVRAVCVTDALEKPLAVSHDLTSSGLELYVSGTWVAAGRSTRNLLAGGWLLFAVIIISSSLLTSSITETQRQHKSRSAWSTHAHMRTKVRFAYFCLCVDLCWNCLLGLGSLERTHHSLAAHRHKRKHFDFN